MNTRSNMLSKTLPRKRSRIQTTLLDLVQAVNQVTEDDKQVAAVVAHLVNTGQARLIGNFKDRQVRIG